MPALLRRCFLSVLLPLLWAHANRGGFFPDILHTQA